MGEVLRADVCILGSGPSGQAVARSLAGSGAEVLIVEAGDRETDRWGRRFASAAMPSIGRQYPNAGHQVSIREGGTSDRWSIRLKPDASGAEGTGIRLHRLDPVDFEPRPIAGADGWPLKMEELDPYYAEAEALFGIPKLEVGLTLPYLDTTVEAQTFWAADRHAVFDPGSNGTPILSRCAVTALTAERAGRITAATARTREGKTLRICADVFVLAMGAVHTSRLLLDSEWTEASSIANSSGLVGCYLTDHPQLILGQLVFDPGADLSTIENLAPTVHPAGVLQWPNLVTSPERSRQPGVARLAMTLLPTARIPLGQSMWNRLPTIQGTRSGAINAAATLVEKARARSFDEQLIRSIPRVAAGLDEIVLALGNSWRGSPGWSVEDPHWRHLIGSDRLAGFQIFAVAEQLPDPENRVRLSDERNSLGGRRARIDWRWSEVDSRRVQTSANDIRQTVERLGIGRVLPRTGRAAMHKINSHHAAGTTRMSQSAADGVVDTNLRAHDHPNLYIVGSSVFKDNRFRNPTLTDIALGLRLGRHLAADAASP